MSQSINCDPAPVVDYFRKLVSFGGKPLPQTGPRRIVILEDDPHCAKLLQLQVLKKWPRCVVAMVAKKSEFVAELQTYACDLVLSDYCIPGFSGVEALAIVRKEYPELPFIFVSGAIGEEVGVECLKLGAVDYVIKERLPRLIPAIERALDQARERHERAQVTLELEQTNKEYEALVNSVDGIVWQADQKTLQFRFVSRQAERLLGYPAESWIKEQDFWQAHIHAEDREQAVRQHRELTLEQGHCQFEYRMIAEDSRIIWLRDNVSVSIQDDGLLHIQGVMVDVTEYKQAEREINRIRLKLEESNKDLLQKNQEIQNFYHTLSHELKTPLTSAREFVSLVMDGVSGQLNEGQLEYLGIAKKSCDQLRLCVNDLIDATRIETGKLSIELRKSSLTRLIHQIATTLKVNASERQIELGTDLPDDPLEISMDELRINQVITNLLNNAIKYAPRGGGIMAKCCTVAGRPDFVQVTVSNTGCGIPKEEQERIFNRLYQIKTGDATSQNGIGLGLYLCKELVQLHGGEIWVESEAGEGCTFKFILPKSHLSFRPNVLVMDDDRDLLEMTCNVLSESYNVCSATNGEDGLREIHRQVPDVILLDLSMPKIDGVAVLKEIREKWNGIAIIVHTAYSNAEIMREAMEYSPFTLLSKPSTVIQIREIVRNVLRTMDTTIEQRNQSIVKTLTER